MEIRSAEKCPFTSVSSASSLQSLDFRIKLLMSREFCSVMARGLWRLREIKQFGVVSPKLCSFASAPAGEPNAERNTKAHEEEYLPGVEEPLEKVPNKFNRSSVPTMPRSGSQMFEDRGD